MPEVHDAAAFDSLGEQQSPEISTLRKVLSAPARILPSAQTSMRLRVMWTAEDPLDPWSTRHAHRNVKGKPYRKDGTQSYLPGTARLWQRGCRNDGTGLSWRTGSPFLERLPMASGAAFSLVAEPPPQLQGRKAQWLQGTTPERRRARAHGPNPPPSSVACRIGIYLVAAAFGPGHSAGERMRLG